jgi:hypothetical protein
MVEQLQGLTESPEDNQSQGAAPGPPSTWAETDSMASSFEDDAATEPKSRVSSTAALLALTLVVAGAALFVMRQTGGSSVDQTPDQAELRIEQTLAQYSGQGARGADGGSLPPTAEVLSRFQNDPRARQVELAYLAKNPFLPAGRSPEELALEEAKPDESEQARARRAEALRREFNALTLQSVMNGAEPVAVIDGELVRPGGRIGSFKVVSIEPRAVLLSAEQSNYRLSMSGPDLGGKR